LDGCVPDLVTIGFDPGTARLGYGVLRGEDPIEVVDFGVLETASGVSMPERLLQLYEGVRRILRDCRPDSCAVERLFFARNVTTALSVGQARGVVLLAAAQAGLAVVEYTPAEIKQAVSGWGKADKSQMQEMVRLLLNLREVPYPDDAADALAVAICHVHTARFKRAAGSR
jgi:crossover junction endodeoxyribonuclease RuvC